MRARREKNESVALDILERKGDNPTKLTATDLMALLTWHQHPQVAVTKKDAKFVAWMEIKRRGKAPPAFDKWTNHDKEQLVEAQSDVVKMAHTALGHLEALKKKELLLAALSMSQKEFNQLAAERDKLIVESADSNVEPLIFDAPNELIVGDADIESDGGDDSSG